MTPSAMTAAGRGSTAAGRGRAAKARPADVGAPGHRRRLRPSPAPARPRRVSGPVRDRSQAARARDGRSLGASALAFARSLPDHSLVDRLVRGRAWIPVLGVLLAGIVAMQVEVLKLGTSMGRWMERGSALQSKNESLQASVSALADDQRIERLAAGMGMIMPAPDAVSFLSAAGGASVSRAIANIHAPDAAAFMALLPAQQSPPTTGPAGVASSSPVPSTTSTVGPTTSTAPAPSGAPAPITASQTDTTTTAAPATSTSPAATTTTASSPSQDSGAAALAPAGSTQATPGG